MNGDLSICIVTFNRKKILEDVLIDLVEKAEKFDVGIYVVDNCSTDGTSDFVNCFLLNNRNVFLVSNERNLGFDGNVAAAALVPDSKYVWVMGDSAFLHEDAIGCVLDVIRKDSPCAIICNCFDRVSYVESGRYIDHSKLFQEIGWHTTFIGSAVWSKDLIKGDNFKKYAGTNFIHFGVLWEYLANSRDAVYWESRSLIKRHHKLKKSGWSNNAIPIWCRFWTELVLSLPDYYSDSLKRGVILSHGVKSKIFFLKAAIVFRANESFGIKQLFDEKNYLWPAMGVRMVTFILIALVPKNVCRCVEYVGRKLIEFLHNER